MITNIGLSTDTFIHMINNHVFWTEHFTQYPALLYLHTNILF